MKQPFVIALLGARRTGKSQLAQALSVALRIRGHTVQIVTEHWHEWCDVQRRLPLQTDQTGIAREQSDRINAAVHSGCGVIIADTTAIMTAAYSEYFFEDENLYADAIASHKTYALTLLMGLDIPWSVDGWHSDEQHVREAVDGLIRQTLQQANIAAPTIYGSVDSRLQAALDIALQAMHPKIQEQRPVWQHICECCGDGASERLLLAKV